MLRSFSSAFTRSTFCDIIHYNDYSYLDWLIERYDIKLRGDGSYYSFLKTIYSQMAREYRCEYVYKNELIHELIKKYGTKSTSIYNEFRVGESIADIAFFNGESKAFEIKTQYDSSKRLNKQLHSYSRVFDKCYVVIPEERLFDYYEPDDKTGIILLKRVNGRMILEEFREAKQNDVYDAALLMSCLRTIEYEKLLIDSFGSLPEATPGQLYKTCCEQICKLPTDVLSNFFITAVKARKDNAKVIYKMPHALRQICLALNLNSKKSEILLEKLYKPIN